MGLISNTWVFCHNLVKIHLVFIEKLSFSCSVLLLVKADGDHLAVPNCKKNQNGLPVMRFKQTEPHCPRKMSFMIRKLPLKSTSPAVLGPVVQSIVCLMSSL